MASAKKLILVFTDCGAKSIAGSSSPLTSKFVQKGCYFSNVPGDASATKAKAAAGAPSGQTIWDAAKAQGLVMDSLVEEFDICVLDVGGSTDDVEKVLKEVLDVAGRVGVIALVAGGRIFFYGPDIAKGKVVDTETSAQVVAPTLAYLANFPMPDNRVAPVTYAALKDINFKFNEIKKLQSAVINMEAAMERKSRQPWDRHDSADASGKQQ